MTQVRKAPWGLLQLAAIIAVFFGGFMVWGLIVFGPRDIPAGAPACPHADWTELNAQGVVFGQFSNSTDRAERNSANGVLARRDDPHVQCLEIFADKTCNLTGPTVVQVNRPGGPIAIVLETGQHARLHNNPRRPFVCGLLPVGPGGE